ncbi:MAG: TIGR02594 family protein [Hyphomicrobiaceae bacterium]|nr:MAG: TIGR02594 family protein [Hyphomicrobiaceae bacterium]
MSQPRWLDFAWGDLGVAEAAGTKNNARVVRYYAEVGHSEVADDEVAWCAAFLGACLERGGIRSTRSLMARSYLSWGEAIAEPRYGAVAVLSRGFDPRLGHVGFLVGTTSDDLILLAGNQGDCVSVQAFPRTRLLGLRWPSASSGASAGEEPQVGDGSGIFEAALAHVLEMEGGYTDDPYDPGGPTNCGITLAEFARDKGIEPSAGNVGALKAELKAIPAATVRRIYLERYWRPAACPALPQALALFHFDAAVNQGVVTAARMLQQAVGADADGEIGPETLAAVAARPLAQTLGAYAEIRRQRYRGLSHFWRFGRGWLRRVDTTLARATALERRSPSVSPQPQEKKAMAEEDQTGTQSASTSTSSGAKWWGESMTIWGVIVTSLSTVLPVLGPVFGINITAELIRQLGDNVVLFGQAAGGLAGTIMTIYGRARATTALERRQITMNL